MKILSIDSSTPQSCSVAFIKDKSIIAQSTITLNTPRSDRILTMVDEVLAARNIEEVDGFAVTCGPGSFTGLRVSASLLKGFVLATGKPFMGINTLEALAGTVNLTSLQICALLDAKKKEVYMAFFKYQNGQIKRLSEDRVCPPETLRNLVTEPTVFVGSGTQTYGAMLSAHLGDLYTVEPGTGKYSLAASAGLLANARFDAEKSFSLDSLQINYIRKSEAEIKLAC
jgi:tRNA threonylcarbamoyladenosine biosynthesis protein TsaB